MEITVVCGIHLVFFTFRELVYKFLSRLVERLPHRKEIALC